jgi:hypothetical protein
MQSINTSNQTITNTDESNATVAYSVFQRGRNVVNVPILHTESTQEQYIYWLDRIEIILTKSKLNQAASEEKNTNEDDQIDAL